MDKFAFVSQAAFQIAPLNTNQQLLSLLFHASLPHLVSQYLPITASATRKMSPLRRYVAVPLFTVAGDGLHISTTLTSHPRTSVGANKRKTRSGMS